MQHLWSSSRADCSRSISSKSSERLVTPVLALPAADEEAAKWCPLDVAVGFDDKWVVEMGPLPPLLPFLILVSILRSKLGELSSERKLTLLAEKDLEAKNARFDLEVDNSGSVHVDADGDRDCRFRAFVRLQCASNQDLLRVRWSSGDRRIACRNRLNNSNSSPG